MTGKELKLAIYLSPLSQRQVADLIGTDRTYLCHLLSGDKPVSEKWVNKILNVLPHNESDDMNNGKTT